MFLVALVLLLILPAVIFWFDMVLNLYNALKRYHIGKWDDFLTWEKAIVKRALRWVSYPPVVSERDKTCYQLFSIIKGDRNKTIQSWQEGMLSLGVWAYDQKNKIFYDKNIFIKKYVSDEGYWKHSVNRVDFALLAYAILKICDDPKAIRPAMDQMIAVIEENICEDGMISYSQGKMTNIRYVDTLGMVCPFLALYGITYGKKYYIDLAVKQIEKFRESGLSKHHSLPCHAYDVKQQIPLGIYGWGRGTAWYFLALMDTWSELEASTEKEKLWRWILEAADSYQDYQSGDGGFSTILQGGGQYDSSVTAAMAYFYSVCAAECKSRKYKNIADLCLEKIKSVTMKSGAIDCCQGDTHGIGIFSQIFDVMPFAQGMILRALALKQ